MQNARRGEIWQIDFGLAAKVRPALVLGCDIADEDRVLVAVVYHTRSLRGSRYEVPMRVPGLDEGGFDAQSLYTIPAVKLIRRRAVLNAAQLKLVEEKVKLWLGLDDLAAVSHDIERQTILRALKQHDFNRTETAKALGISRRTLVYRLQHLRALGLPVDPE